MFSRSEKELNPINIKLYNRLIFKKYRIIKQISESVYSQMYLVINEKTKKFYSMKIENKDSNFNKLQQEAYYLYEIKGKGIPEFITFGKIGNNKIFNTRIIRKVPI